MTAALGYFRKLWNIVNQQNRTMKLDSKVYNLTILSTQKNENNFLQKMKLSAHRCGNFKDICSRKAFYRNKS